jgi:hypothetical protein
MFMRRGGLDRLNERGVLQKLSTPASSEDKQIDRLLADLRRRRHIPTAMSAWSGNSQVEIRKVMLASLGRT